MSANYLKDKRHIHFIAIGGIGMSAIALVLLKRGCRISGSDLRPNSLTEKLALMGAQIYTGHKKENIKQTVDLVVHSACIGADNPEMKEAARRNIAVAPRGKILAELMSEKDGIAVCGCHGKTTTSAMIATILTDAGFDPTALIGGEVDYLASNARLGLGRYLVAEADESDGSFLSLKPMYSVVTNIDEDHMEYFKDQDGLMRRFREYVWNIKKGGCFIYSADDQRLADLQKHCRADAVSFGLEKTADVRARDIICSSRISDDSMGLDSRTLFDCYYKSKRLGRFKIRVPGIHNVLNALAAICVCLRLGMSLEQIKSGLDSFTGTKRRFQMRGCFGGVTVIEDYAHHPSEIMATLKAAEGFGPKRIIGVFQPHRFTRTLYLADRFGGCFGASDLVILTDIYSASEKPLKGITGRLIYDKIISAGHKNVAYIDKEKITEHICRIKKPGDMVVILGAGDINSIADELVQRLR